MFAQTTVFLTATLLAFAPFQEQDEDPIFSGPQAGETVANFEMTGVFADEAYKEIDIVKQADGGPLLLMFIHERSRPAFGLSNAMAKYAASRDEDQLTCGVCYLSDDSSEARNWMNRVKQYFNKSVTFGISKHGIEGPGEYGLNRNVAMTILVVDENKVAANFALIQPALQADGQKVIDAVSKVLGTKPAPKITQFINRPRGQANNQMSEDLGLLLRKMLNKESTAEQVNEHAGEIEEYLKKHPAQKWRLGATCRRLVNSGRLETYGTTRAQQLLEDWSEKYVLLTDRVPEEMRDRDKAKTDDRKANKKGGKTDKKRN